VSGRHREPAAAGRHRKPPQRSHLVVPALVSVTVLGAGGVSAAAALSGGGEHAAPRPRLVPGLVVPSPQPLAPQPVTTAAAGPLPTPRPAAPKAVSPGLKLTAIGRVSWVQVVGRHHRVLFVGMLRHGRSLTFTQRPLAVTLGDAGAVRIDFNGKVYRRAGRPGQVRLFHV
jgi:hypothetical protein